MQYPKLEVKKEKMFTVDTFSRGIEKNSEEATISNCKNIISRADAVTNRPSVEITDGEFFYKENPNHKNNIECCKTGVFLDGKNYTISVFSNEIEDERLVYNFFLFDEDGKATKLPIIKFERKLDEVYNHPQSLTVFSAMSKKGCGVYAFISAKNKFAENVNDMYTSYFYELSNGKSEWLLLDFLDMYIPKYYINGRGHAFVDAFVEYPEPEYVEPINLLNNACQCTYNSDGESFKFYLPPEITYDREFAYFNCKVYLTDEELLDFTVNPETKTSNKIVYEDKEVFVRYKEKEGCFVIYNYIPPENNELRNNIVATIRLKAPENSRKFTSANKSVWYSSREAGGYLCLAGNIENPSQIWISAKDNPLYFPDGNCHLIGDPSQKITALARQNKALVVFKEKEIYCADCVSNKITVTHLHSSIGCDLPDTVAICENRLVWANSDKKVYTLNSLSDYGAVAVYGMSRAVDDEFKNQDFSFATACYTDRRYYLFLKNCVYVLDLSGALLQSNREFVSAAAWFKWELPQQIDVKVSYANKNHAVMVCCIGDTKDYYVAALKGQDGVDKFFDGSLTRQNKVIECMLTTGVFYNKDYANKKMFSKLLMNLFAERDVAVDFIDESGAIIKNTLINIKYNAKNAATGYKLLPFVRGLGMSLNIRAYGSIKLNKLIFFYKENI